VVIANRVNISNVLEMKFNTPPYYGYRHCVYLIELESSARYIFDPTGIQFGPQWPLLCVYDEYEQYFMHPITALRSMRFRPLGTNYQLLIEGRGKDF
jgi:hypothetical protein